MNYSTYSNEELVSIIQSGDEAAYDQLFRNLAPITLHEAEMYRGKMDTYGTEDFLQEGNIVAWEIISRGNFKGGKFSTYFGAAIRNRLIRIWRDYNLKNLSLAYGADQAHKISTEDEAKETLDWYGRHQPEENTRCPRCGEMMWGPRERHALSRYASITVCDRCECEEALECAGMVEKRSLMKWCAIVLPSVGGGAWRR